MKLDRHVDGESLHGLLGLTAVGAEPRPILSTRHHVQEVCQVGHDSAPRFARLESTPLRRRLLVFTSGLTPAGPRGSCRRAREAGSCVCSSRRLYKNACQRSRITGILSRKIGVGSFFTVPGGVFPWMHRFPRRGLCLPSMSLLAPMHESFR